MPKIWNLYIYQHIRQRDSYNCGVYITYYFERLLKQLPLTNDFDTSKYRNYLKLILT